MSTGKDGNDFKPVYGDLMSQQQNSDNLPEFLRTGDDWKKEDDADEETQRADQLTERDYENAVGLREFQTAMEHASKKNFDEAALYLKEGLKTLK